LRFGEYDARNNSVIPWRSASACTVCAALVAGVVQHQRDRSRQALPGDMLRQVFLGGAGIARTRCHFSPKSFRNLRTCVGPRLSSVNCSIRAHASAIVLTGRSSNDLRIASRHAACSRFSPQYNDHNTNILRRT
jgi:hypothetical protein